MTFRLKPTVPTARLGIPARGCSQPGRGGSATVGEAGRAGRESIA